MRIRTHALLVALIVALAVPVPAQETQKTSPEEWLARYARALDLNPDNAFYQYAVLRAARRLDVEPPATSFHPPRQGRWNGQIYEMTTGAWAVQGSLQIDRLVGEGDVVSEPT